MHKRWLFILCTCFVLAACSSNDSSESSEDTANSGNATADQNFEQSNQEMEMANESKVSDQAKSNQTEDQQGENSQDKASQERKVIYTANLRLEVKNYTEALNEIQSQVAEKNGYVVESRTYGGSSEELQEGMIKVRIPQQQFETFIQIVEQGSMKVIEKTVTGQDVTEEFVDLQSRLQSKKVVEERLTTFMQQAEKTEDLLKISNDLADIQEEIERITGRLNYLQNKADLATITIHLHENRVNIPNVNDEDLNTWEKTKQQFMNSVNFLLAAGSGLIIFIVGNLPTLLLLAVVGLIGYRTVKKQRKKE